MHPEQLDAGIPTYWLNPGKLESSGVVAIVAVGRRAIAWNDSVELRATVSPFSGSSANEETTGIPCTASL
jgi:hypothetical protein